MVTWEEAAELPPPPAAPEARIGVEGVPFTPYTVAPSLVDAEAVQRALMREYPPILRDAGSAAVYRSRPGVR